MDVLPFFEAHLPFLGARLIASEQLARGRWKVWLSRIVRRRYRISQSYYHTFT